MKIEIKLLWILNEQHIKIQKQMIIFDLNYLIEIFECILIEIFLFQNLTQINILNDEKLNDKDVQLLDDLNFIGLKIDFQ